MKSKARFFYLSQRDLEYQEIRWFRAKLSSLLIFLTAISLFSLLAVNHYYYDFLGLGYSRVQTLVTENEALKHQLAMMTGQLKHIAGALDRLYDRNNELRLLVDLPRIDEDTRRAGVGGREQSFDVAVASPDARQILASSSVLLGKVSREIQLQRQSYEEIVRRYEDNKEFFARIPALKPMEGYYAVSGFGRRMHPVLGIYKTHDGLDIINDVGTPVYATGDGVVDYAARSGGGYGIVIVINHGYGYQTLYAHLSKVLVRAGQNVKRGDMIARSGRTGLVSGPHLHYEVRYRGMKLNPVDFFLDDIKPGTYKSMVSATN